MRFVYSRQLSPPALMLPLHFRGLGSFKVFGNEGKIDTAADMTAIPLRLQEELALKPFTRRRTKGALNSKYVSMPTYLLECSFDGSEFFELEVLVTTRPYVLLGRDFLNSLVLIANGPQQFFEIQKPYT